MNSYEKLITELRAAEDDIIKGYAGNKAAAVRARKALQALSKEHAKAIRAELLSVSKGEAAAQEITSQMPTPMSCEACEDE